MSEQGNRQELISTDVTSAPARFTRFGQNKTFKFILRLAIALIVCAALGAWSTYDYGLRCTKCLAGKHVVEQRFFGIPFFRSTTTRATEADYERIFGHPCQHIFRKGGFGRGSRLLFMPAAVACGSTAEGSFVRPRIEAVSATYAVERRLPGRELALDTLRAIDQMWPPDIKLEQREEISQQARSTVLNLGFYLPRVKTVEQWQAVLTAAQGGFKDVSNLPAE